MPRKYTPEEREARARPGYHDPTAGWAGAPPARSALTLRLVLASFGLLVCGLASAAFVVVVDQASSQRSARSLAAVPWVGVAQQQAGSGTGGIPGEDRNMRIGYKLATEAFGAAELIRQAVLAEEAGFDFVEMSDHYHPWLEAQGHSAFTWSVLPVIAAKTERIGLATGVTCPSVRYHPAIIAQAAATMALVSDGRFTLGVGAGERLNEHVVGLGFPGERVRHERFREALEIIRLLWRGGYQSYQGKHLQLEDARVFDLPGELPVIAVAASGPVSARIAAELGDGLFATEPDGDLVSSWRKLGGSGPAYAEMPLAWAADEDKAAQAVLEKSRFALTGWKVMAELPNPVNFEAATASITADQVKAQFACGPDASRHMEVARQFAGAGFDHLVAMNAGPDPDGFMDFFARELAGPLRALTPRGTAEAP